MASLTTNPSWFGRILESIRGVVVGLLLIAGSLAGIWWNEGRAVETARRLEEGRGRVISIETSRIDPANEGKLVHLTGRATAEATLVDEEFPEASARALRLERHVEMFQWKESRRTQRRDRDEGGTETVVTTAYSKEWSSEPIDSNRFRDQSGDNPKRNPPMPIRGRSFEASPVRLGAFLLPAHLVARIDAWEPLRLGLEPVSTDPPRHRRGFRLLDGQLYRGGDPAAPKVGALRVSFRVVRPTAISVVAVQRGDSFESFPAENGDRVEILEVGLHSAESLFQTALAENETTTWSIRGAGTLLMAIGIFLVFRPLAVIANVIPLLGDLMGAGLFLFAIALSLALSAIGIGVAWLSFRPRLGGGLLAGGLVVLVIARSIGGKTRKMKRAVLG